MSAIPSHVINHTRNESYDSDEISRFSEDSDSETNDPPLSNNDRSKHSSGRSSTSTVNNSPPSKRRLCSINWSRIKKSLRSLLWWKKQDKNKEPVLPVTKVSVEVKEKQEKQRKKRTCCLIILLIIIILFLLGNLLALDVVYFRSPVLQTNNITTLLNGTNSPNAISPTQEPNFKAITCANMLSLPPKEFPCDFCFDDQSFYNVTTFCALKIMWANALNQTALEVNLRWMQSHDFCDWIGITCDKNNNITGLDLTYPNSIITFDFSVERLTSLQKLTVSGDGQHPNDAIPLGLFRLPNLVEFSLTSTALSGAIPNTLDKMTSIKKIEFRNNRLLNGTLPESLSTTSLTFLVLNGQNISGPIPDFIGNSKTLQSSLQQMDLSSNQFTGTIPDSLLNLSNLTSINLGSNLLTGEPFPSIINAKFAKSLLALDLSGNGFSGTIPPSINQFGKLVDLNLQKNSFTGQIPAEVSSLTRLDAIFLNNNNFTGNIPAEIGNLNVLSVLLLNDNDLTGNIPPGVCKNYSNCNLARNQFTTIPTICGNCQVR